LDKNSRQYLAYQLYLKSFKWRFKRWLKLRQVGSKCQNCGSTGYLECHHLNYDRLGSELLSDLRILCHNCHKLADEIRRLETARNTFMVKKYGPDWLDRWTLDEATREFEQWLQTKTN